MGLLFGPQGLEKGLGVQPSVTTNSIGSEFGPDFEQSPGPLKT